MCGHKIGRGDWKRHFLLSGRANGRSRWELGSCMAMTVCDMIVLFFLEYSILGQSQIWPRYYTKVSQVSKIFSTLSLFPYPSTHSTWVSIIEPMLLSDRLTITYMCS